MSLEPIDVAAPGGGSQKSCLVWFDGDLCDRGWLGFEEISWGFSVRVGEVSRRRVVDLDGLLRMGLCFSETFNYQDCIACADHFVCCRVAKILSRPMVRNLSKHDARASVVRVCFFMGESGGLHGGCGAWRAW